MNMLCSPALSKIDFLNVTSFLIKVLQPIDFIKKPFYKKAVDKKREIGYNKKGQTKRA